MGPRLNVVVVFLQQVYCLPDLIKASCEKFGTNPKFPAEVCINEDSDDGFECWNVDFASFDWNEFVKTNDVFRVCFPGEGYPRSSLRVDIGRYANFFAYSLDPKLILETGHLSETTVEVAEMVSVCGKPVLIAAGFELGSIDTQAEAGTEIENLIFDHATELLYIDADSSVKLPDRFRKMTGSNAGWYSTKGE